MSSDKLQKFFSDLYRDLADRRLLLPVIGLAVAIVAVPILLSSPAEQPVVPAPAVDVSDATAVEGAVIVSDHGIRDYRQRLADLKSKNPFDQQYAGGGDDQAAATEVTGSGFDTSSTSTGSTGSSSGTGSTDVEISGGGGSVSVDTGGPPVDTGPPTTAPTSPAPGEPPEVETTVRFFSDRIDVKVGPVGDTKLIKDVRHLDFLPDDKTPIVAFLGLAGGPDHAIFSVNPAVIETGGEGACAPKGADGCQYLNLKIGEERYFKYGFGPDAETYRLKLVDTHIVRVPDPRDDRGGDESDDSQ